MKELLKNFLGIAHLNSRINFLYSQMRNASCTEISSIIRIEQLEMHIEHLESQIVFLGNSIQEIKKGKP